ncbi:MAG: hypothetical protein ACJ8DC_05545 [Gemmatimonadales bacterium]
MIAESVDRRVLAALRFVDGVTGAMLQRPLVLEAPGTRWIRNASGHWVLAEAPGLESHPGAFIAPPATPALGSVALTIGVRDPAGSYLARRVTIALPRNPDPGAADQPASLFRPIAVPLYLAPAASLASGWAVLRLTVTGATPASRLGGALLRVALASDGTVLARGLSDDRGEALVAVPGIPVTTWSEAPGAVIVNQIEARVAVIPNPNPAVPPDPETMDALAASKQVNVMLASGRTQVLVV